MIGGSPGRARCPTHDVEAHFTCPRCGVFTCAECREPKEPAAALRRSVQLACHRDGDAATQLCGACLARPRRGARVGGLVGAGVALLGLVAVAAAFVHL